MAEITGYTATRMKEIEDTTVVDGDVVVDDLVLIQRNGVQINAGNVRGAQGIQGIQGPPGTDGIDGTNGVDGESFAAGYVEPLDNRGDVSGTVTLDFSMFNIWRINPIGAVTIAFTGLPLATEIAPGTLIIANSNFAITWPVGTKYPEAAPPELDGETFLSMVARSTEVTVGISWIGVA